MSPVQRFSINDRGRDWVVGDIHGYFRRLQVQLDELGFDPEVDRLFSVGDLVDRGPDSELMLEWLAKPWFHAVMGNHEEIALDSMGGHVSESYHSDPRIGGDWFVRASPDLRQAVCRAILELPIAIEIQAPVGKVGLVHAECPTHDWPSMVNCLEGMHGENERHYMANACLWGRNRLELARATGKAIPVTGVRAVINGHNEVKSTTWLGNSVLINTNGPTGRFTLMDLATLADAHLRVPKSRATEEQLRVVPAMQA